MKRKLLSLLLITALVFEMQFFGSMAIAQGTLSVTASANPRVVAGSGTVDFTVNVKNDTGGDLNNINIIISNDKGTSKEFVNAFNLANGSSDQKVFTFANAPAGNYTVTASNGNVNGSVAVGIEGKDAISLTRSASKTIANIGDKIAIHYVVTNNSSTAITGIKLSDPTVPGFGSETFDLNPDEAKSYDYSFKILQNITSKPTVESSSGVSSIDPITIKTNTPKLNISIKADKDSIKAGDTVNLTCTVTNTGSVAFKSVIVSDDTLGNIQTIQDLKPGKTNTFTKSATVSDGQTFLFHAQAKDYSNNPFTFTSNEVKFQTVKAAPLNISIKATSSTTSLKKAGNVDFEVVVSNKGTESVKNVTVTEDSIGEIGKMDVLGIGDKLFKKTVEVSASKKFVFKVQVTDTSGNVQTFTSDPIQVNVGVSPSATAAASNGKAKGLLTILGVIIFLIIAAVISLVILTVQDKKVKKKNIFRKH